MHTQDELFMREAVVEAQKAFMLGEVPVGAVLVHQGRVVAKAHNQVETLRDATSHAEIVCLRKGARVMDSWRLLGCTLYTTLEPCAMCAGAMIASRVDSVVWGARDFRQGASESWTDVLRKPHPIHTVQSRGGVLSDECGDLMRKFFQIRRGSSGFAEICEELIALQNLKIRRCAHAIVPGLTDDDLLQPNDFPALENHPYFRYEEGVREGLMTARMSWLRMRKSLASNQQEWFNSDPKDEL